MLWYIHTYSTNYDAASQVTAEYIIHDFKCVAARVDVDVDVAMRIYTVLFVATTKSS